MYSKADSVYMEIMQKPEISYAQHYVNSKIEYEKHLLALEHRNKAQLDGFFFF